MRRAARIVAVTVLVGLLALIAGLHVRAVQILATGHTGVVFGPARIAVLHFEYLTAGDFFLIVPPERRPLADYLFPESLHVGHDRIVLIPWLYPVTLWGLVTWLTWRRTRPAPAAFPVETEFKG